MIQTVLPEAAQRRSSRRSTSRSSRTSTSSSTSSCSTASPWCCMMLLATRGPVPKSATAPGAACRRRARERRSTAEPEVLGSLGADGRGADAELDGESQAVTSRGPAMTEVAHARAGHQALRWPGRGQQGRPRDPARARSSASSGRTAPARRRSSTSSRASRPHCRARSSSAAGQMIARPSARLARAVLLGRCPRDRRRPAHRGPARARQRAARRWSSSAPASRSWRSSSAMLLGDRPAALVPRGSSRDWASSRAPGRTTWSQAGIGPDVPEHPPVPEHDRAGERARGHAHQAEGDLIDALLSHAASQARGGRPRCRAQRAASPRRAEGRDDDARAATCPTATSAAWRSRAPSAATRCCCCSTSRPPA